MFFSHSVGGFFILPMVSFTVHKLLSLIRAHSFNLCFCFLCLRKQTQKISVQLMSKNVLPMFSSTSFMVYSLIFRSLIHFDFIFVHSMRKCSNFILLYVTVQFSQHQLLKRLCFPHCIFLTPLLWIN